MTWTKAEIAAQHDLVGRSVAEQRRLRAEQVALREAMQQDALRRAQDTAEQRIREQARELVRIRQGRLDAEAAEAAAKLAAEAARAPAPPRQFPPIPFPSAAPRPVPVPSAPPKPAAVQPAPTPIHKRCRDCGDQLPLHRAIDRCVRCNKVRLEASEQQRDEAARTVRPPVVYRCLVCHASMPQPESVCQRCRDTDRYREQPDDSLPTLRRETGAFPHLAWYTNAQGESVVNGRVLPHPRYGESAWDRFGDTPDWD